MSIRIAGSPSRRRRLLGAAIAGALVVGGFATVTAMGAGTPARADSVSGGQITRGEVLQRAKYWYDQGQSTGHPTYSQTGWYPDPQGKKYRTDCSGYVSMMWHTLRTDLVVSEPPQNGLTTVSHRIAKNDLEPGDALMLLGQHVRLFEKWADAGHTSFWAYDFPGPVGTLPVHKVRQYDNSYIPYRYNNIVDDPPPYPVVGGRLVDFDGDGRPDVVGYSADRDELWFVPNTSVVGAPSIGQSSQVSPALGGWATVSQQTVADYDGDGKPDVLGRNGDHLLVWLNTSTPGHPGVSPLTDLGDGWNTLSKWMLADFTGDGKPDVVGMSLDGDELWVVVNTSTAGHPGRGQSIRVSAGWATVSNMMLTDYDGDGKTDIIGRAGDALLIWRNTSANGVPSITGYTGLGVGWNGTSTITMADLTADGKPDLVYYSLNGDVLYVAPNTSTPGNPSGGSRLTVSSGWATVSNVMVGDYDGDGKTDIIGRAPGNSLLVWRNTSSNGVPSVAPYVSIGSNWNTLPTIITTSPTL